MKRHLCFLIIKIFILNIIFISFVGCNEKVELDELSVVTGIAIDKADDSDKLKVTIQSFNTASSKERSGGGSNGSEGAKTSLYINSEGIGDTVSDALFNIMGKSPKRLFFAHCSLLIYNEEIARKGIKKYLDYFVRSAEKRRDVYVLTTKNNAYELLETNNFYNKTPTQVINDTLEYSPNVVSTFTVMKIQQFISDLQNKCKSATASNISIDKDGLPKILGTSVFKEEKLVGYLDETETQGYLRIINKLKGGILLVECSLCDDKINLQIKNTSTKISPEIEGENPSITLKVKEEAIIYEQMCSVNFSKEPMKSHLEKDQEEVIKNQMMAAIKKAQSLKADIFGFCETIEKKDPKKWKEIAPHWDDVFSNMNVNIIIESKTIGSGIITHLPD